MTKRLRDLTVNEVSLVPAGAIRKRFILTKADKTETVTETETTKVELSAVEKALAEAVEGEDAPVEGTDIEIARAVRRLTKGLSADAVKAVLGIKDPAPVAKADVEADPLADLPVDAKAKVEALFKAQADATAAQAQKLETLTKALDDARDEKEVREEIQKAEKDFPNLPEKADKLGPALRTLRKADAKAFAIVEDVLKRANVLCAKGLEPVGKSDPTGEAGGTALEKLNKMAAARAAADKVPFAVGFDRTLNENKDLYTAYEAEKREGAKGN